MSSTALRYLSRRSGIARSSLPVLAATATATATHPTAFDGRRPFSTQQQRQRRRRRPKPSSQFQTKDTSLQVQEQPSAAPTSSERLLSQSADLLESAAASATATAPSFGPGSGSGHDGPFSPGMPVDEYLKMASLSPWVPCPDAVARRMLEIAKVTPDDVHYDLGCGDGRVNFHALDAHAVRKTVGVDVDPSLVERAEGRVARRHPRPENVGFAVADLLDVEEGGEGSKIWDDIANEATVVTMYFVEEALLRLRPILEDRLANSGVRVVTCGYEMKGWQARWGEIVLGLPVHLYVMRDDEDEPPTPEEIRGAMMEGVLDEEDVRKAVRESGGPGEDEWRAGDKVPEPEIMDYRLDPDERIDFHWDFDEKETYDDEDGGKNDQSSGDGNDKNR